MDDMKHFALVLALSATVMLTGLGSSRLWDDDEPRNAGCAREMLARWDWIVPWFNNELRAHKPVLTYWCIMASYLVLGESEFSARLPSALAAIGTTLLTYAVGRRLFSPEAALWAALILPTTMLFAMAGRIATPDSLLIFCVTLAMAAFVWTAWPHEADGEMNHAPHETHDWKASSRPNFFPHHWWQAAAIYAAMGLGVLAKGPVGIVLPTAILGMFLLIVRWQPGTLTRRVSQGESGSSHCIRFGLISVGYAIAHFFRTAWSMRPLTALLVVALVAAPWYLAVGYQTNWQFLEEFFIKHNVARATGAMEGHRGGIWFYPVMLLVGFFPWSIFAIPMAIDARAAAKQNRRDRIAVVFLLCWLGVWLGAFTLAKTKLPSYATPCFPAVALLAGRFVERLVSGKLAVASYWPPIAFLCLAGCGIAACISITVVADQYLPGEGWLGILGALPLFGGVVALAFWWQSRPTVAITGVAASGALLVLGVFALGASVADRHQQSDRLLAAILDAERPQVASFRVLEPSWVYYGRTPIREIHESPQEAAAFLASSPSALLITTERQWQSISAKAVSPDVVVLARVERFLKKDDRLVLVGRPKGVAARRSPLQR